MRSVVNLILICLILQKDGNNKEKRVPLNSNNSNNDNNNNNNNIDD